MQHDLINLMQVDAKTQHISGAPQKSELNGTSSVFNIYFFHPQPTNPIRAHQYPGQPPACFCPRGPRVKLEIKNVSSGQSVLFLVRKCSVCVCCACTHQRGWVVWLRGSRRGLCVLIYVLVIVCVWESPYVPAWKWSNSKALVLLQGVILPPMLCIFTPK